MGNDIASWRSAIGVFYNKCRGVSMSYFYRCNFFLNLLLDVVYKLKLTYYNVQRVCSFLHLCVNNLQVASIICLLVLMSGDVELNPGPDTGTQHRCALSLIHLNIRSIRNKFDYITNNFLDFDILCFTESHLDDTVDSESVFIDSFSVYRKDRSSNSGGLLTYVSNNLYSVRLLDLETDSVHSVRIEVKSPFSSLS